ncbi:MAG: hypothetical protein GY859_37225 [Desulfobacterales bacterium]|nr:hypothetical protein [Desulfobacterales bacterium]
MKRTCYTIFIMTIILITASAAGAYQYPGNISTLGNMVGDSGTLYTGGLSGMFTATGVGYEANYNNSFVGGGNTIFSSGDLPTGAWSSAFNWNSAMFTSVQGTSSIDHIQVYQLNETWTLGGSAGPINFDAGTYLIGFGDGIGDSDYDDLIIAAKAVPIPGAVWLFAAGVIGIIGVRKKTGK